MKLIRNLKENSLCETKKDSEETFCCLPHCLVALAKLEQRHSKPSVSVSKPHVPPDFLQLSHPVSGTLKESLIP